MKTAPRNKAASGQTKGTRGCVVPTVAQASRAIIKTKTSGCKHNNGVLMTVEEGNRLEKWKLQQKRNAERDARRSRRDWEVARDAVQIVQEQPQPPVRATQAKSCGLLTDEEEMLLEKIEDPMLRRNTREKWLREKSKRKRDLLLALTKEKKENEREENLRSLSEKRQEMDKKVLRTPWGRHYGKLVEVLQTRHIIESVEQLEQPIEGKDIVINRREKNCKNHIVKEVTRAEAEEALRRA